MGRPPTHILAAAEWLTKQPDLMKIATADIRYRACGPHSPVNPHWRTIVKALKAAGLYSHTTGVIDVPVEKIVAKALARQP